MAVHVYKGTDPRDFLVLWALLWVSFTTEICNDGSFPSFTVEKIRDFYDNVRCIILSEHALNPNICVYTFCIL